MDALPTIAKKIVRASALVCPFHLVKKNEEAWLADLAECSTKAAQIWWALSCLVAASTMRLDFSRQHLVLHLKRQRLKFCVSVFEFVVCNKDHIRGRQFLRPVLMRVANEMQAATLDYFVSYVMFRVREHAGLGTAVSECVAPFRGRLSPLFIDIETRILARVRENPQMRRLL